MFSIDEDKIITYSDVRQPDAANFNSRADLAAIVATKGWSKDEVTAVWNGFAGTPEFNELKEQKCFKNRDYGVGRIWDVIQRLAVPIPSNGHVVPVAVMPDATESLPEAETADSIAQNFAVRQELPARCAQEAPVAPAEAAAPKSTTRKPKAPKATKTPKPAKAPKAKKTPKAKKEHKPRAESKKAEVIRLLQRKNGASIADIQAASGGVWQPHTARGFLFGSLKKAGLNVTSEKPEGSKERRYYLPAAK
jgi:hypothetical protein